MKNKLCIILSLLFSISGYSQKKYAEQFDKYMLAQVTVNEFSGVVIVSKNGKNIYKKPFGLADREWGIKNSIETKFEIGSLTKQFTAVSILKLVEQNKLDLTDRLTKYFPQYPKGDSITIQMLLNHTSGIVDYTSIPKFYDLHTLPLKQDSVVSLFKHLPPLFSPGTKWAYSNSNYFLLGVIIEKITSQSFANFLFENVISKAELKNTYLNNLDSIITFRAKAYSKTDKGHWKNADYMSMELPFSAGAIISTAEDLLKWQKQLFEGKIISTTLLSKMTQQYLGKYGYGLFIDSLGNHPRISHSGNIPGFTSFLGYFPKDSISMTIVSNDDANSRGIGEDLSSILFNLPFEIPYITVEKSINTAVLKKYIGKYQLGGTMKFELFEKNNTLFIKPEGGHEWDLRPESETRFFFSWDKEKKIDFILDSSRNISNIYFLEKSNKVEIKRL